LGELYKIHIVTIHDTFLVYTVIKYCYNPTSWLYQYFLLVTTPNDQQMALAIGADISITLVNIFLKPR